MSYCGVNGVWNGTACSTDTRYTSGELDDIAVDFVGTYGAQLVVFAALIALAVLFVWFRKKM